jgi:hypothetical protein
MVEEVDTTTEEVTTKTEVDITKVETTTTTNKTKDKTWEVDIKEVCQAHKVCNNSKDKEVCQVLHNQLCQVCQVHHRHNK